MYYKNSIFIKLVKQQIKKDGDNNYLSVYFVNINDEITFKDIAIVYAINDFESNFIYNYLSSKQFIQNPLYGSYKKYNINNVSILFIILLILIITIIIISLIVKIRCNKNFS